MFHRDSPYQLLPVGITHGNSPHTTCRSCTLDQTGKRFFGPIIGPIRLEISVPLGSPSRTQERRHERVTERHEPSERRERQVAARPNPAAVRGLKVVLLQVCATLQRLKLEQSRCPAEFCRCCVQATVDLLGSFEAETERFGTSSVLAPSSDALSSFFLVLPFY